MLVAAVGAALVTAIAVRRRRATALFKTASPPGEGGVIRGAEPIVLGQGGRGVLIVHGFGDTPQSVRSLSVALHENGWTVRAPLLSGHGSSLRAFTASRADDWLADARTALRELRSHATHVTLVGQSMGGALTTILASETPVDAMVLLAPFLRLSRRAERIARFHFAVSVFAPYLRSRSESSILDPEARSRALGKGVTTPRLVRELAKIVDHARHAATRIRAPTLVIHSPQDPRVAVPDAEAAFAQLGCEVKTLKWATRSGHVLSADYDRDWIQEEVLRWLDGRPSHG